MDITQIITIGTAVIGSATLIFRGLEGLARLTKSDKDDHAIAKVLYFLTEVSKFIALNKSNNNVKVVVANK